MERRKEGRKKDTDKKEERESAAYIIELLELQKLVKSDLKIVSFLFLVVFRTRFTSSEVYGSSSRKTMSTN